jgi:hypothetical protein
MGRQVHFGVRLEDEHVAALVVVGARSDGTKEVIALEDGFRESTESWESLLRDPEESRAPRRLISSSSTALGDISWA